MQDVYYRYKIFKFYKWEISPTKDDGNLGKIFFLTKSNIFKKGGSKGVRNLGRWNKSKYDLIEVVVRDVWSIDISFHKLEEILYWFYEEEVFSRLIFRDIHENLSVRMEKVERAMKMQVIEWDDTNLDVLLNRMDHIEKKMKKGYEDDD